MKIRFWLGFISYLLPTFPLGYFWHLKIFHADYLQLEMYRQDVLIPLGLSSMIIQGIVFSWMYPKLFATGRRDWMKSSLKAFGVFFILAWSFVVLPVAAKYRMTSVIEFVKLESLFTLLQFMVTAPLIAYSHRE